MRIIFKCISHTLPLDDGRSDRAIQGGLAGQPESGSQLLDR